MIAGVLVLTQPVFGAESCSMWDLRDSFTALPARSALKQFSVPAQSKGWAWVPVLALIFRQDLVREGVRDGPGRVH
jgi:hypothetical protein